MSWLTALTDEQMNDDQRKAFDRALSKLNLESPDPRANWLRVLANSPEYLKDTYMNLERGVFADGKLTAKSKLLVATVVASHHGNAELAEFFAARTEAAGFTREQINEGVGMAATTTSFNHYYKFRSLTEDDEFAGFNVGLRASLFVKSTLGKALGELISIVISSANGCPSCVKGHVNAAQQTGVSKDQIDEAVRTAAIVQSIASFVG